MGQHRSGIPLHKVASTEDKAVMQDTRPQPPHQVHVIRDEAVGLSATIVIHSTALGPAAGGCRLWAYADLDAMSVDACRLAEGMSYKNALAGLPFGGGKAVVQRPASPFDRAALFRAFGRAVRDLRGQYVTAEDVGTTVEDMGCVAEETRHVAGLSPRDGQVGGDPSPFTARGVFLAMKVAAERRLERPLSDCTVAIQGVGNVGAALAEMLHHAGARLLIADVDSAAAARVAVRTGAQLCGVDAILTARADIVAPCALGGVISARNAHLLQAKVVCGAANNQLAEPEDGDRLMECGVLYIPDYVANAGGIINVAAEYLGWPATEAARLVEAIPDRLTRLLDEAHRDGVAPNRAADELARRVIACRSAERLAA
jgi:leucine dehydrogenase